MDGGGDRVPFGDASSHPEISDLRATGGSIVKQIRGFDVSMHVVPLVDVRQAWHRVSKMFKGPGLMGLGYLPRRLWPTVVLFSRLWSRERYPI